MIADDHDGVRQVLRALLAMEAGFEVLAEARNGREAVELAQAYQPDIIIMDVNMPVLDGISATRQTLDASPSTKVIMHSANRETSTIRRSVAAGAVGYLCKPTDWATLVGTLRDAHRGHTPFAAIHSSLDED